VRERLWGGEFWTDGYFASTVGRHGNEKAIGAYVRRQGSGYRTGLFSSGPERFVKAGLRPRDQQGAGAVEGRALNTESRHDAIRRPAHGAASDP
jgi:hypothetical protein